MGQVAWGSPSQLDHPNAKAEFGRGRGRYVAPITGPVSMPSALSARWVSGNMFPPAPAGLKHSSPPLISNRTGVQIQLPASTHPGPDVQLRSPHVPHPSGEVEGWAWRRGRSTSPRPRNRGPTFVPRPPPKNEIVDHREDCRQAKV